MFSDKHERIFVPANGWRHTVAAMLGGGALMFVTKVFWSEGGLDSSLALEWSGLLAIVGAICFSLVVLPEYRIAAIIGGVVAGLGSYAATLVYLLPREKILQFELLIPGVLGGLPGFLLIRLLASFQRPAAGEASEVTATATPRFSAQLSSPTDLGEMRHFYAVSQERQHKFGVATALALVIAATGVYLKVMVEFDDKDRSMPILFITGGAVAAIVCGGLWAAGLGRSFEVRERGLIVRRLGSVRVVTWESIRTLRETLSWRPEYPLHWLTIDVLGQRRIWLTNAIANHEQLFRSICDEVSRRMLPEVLDAIDTAQPVVFGALGLTQLGFEHLGKKLGYESVASLRVQNGVFEIHKHGQSSPWYSCPFGEIPNGPLLLSVLENRGRKL